MFSKDEVGEKIFPDVESESENFHHLELESKSFICLESELEIILLTPQPWLGVPQIVKFYFINFKFSFKNKNS